jgi:ribonuclease R
VATGRGRARLEKALGPAERIENVLEGLLEHEGVRSDFEPHDPPWPSLEGRVDLRDQLAFTIDPETAKDFDDAISVRREGDGLRAWVHIADVSHFVPAGTPLDRGAAERSFSVYVPGLVAPMLPPELADDLCSLRPHQDRLCVTVEVPFDARLEPGEPSFYRSVIRSHERLTYGRAERILAGDERADDDLADGLGLSERLALELRRRRFARGALRISSREIAFAFDGKGGVERASLESEPHAHMLVEELMILANEAVAGLLAGRRREAIYRVHERPDPQAIGHLLAKLADLQVPTPPAPDEERLTPGLAAGLAAQVSESVSDYVERSGRGREAFPALVLRALKQARYDTRNLGHSGLASPAYSHFTSPIRRYPDLVVHRALLRELGVADEPPAEEPEELAEHCSATERRAADIEYRADDICLAWLLEAVLFERGWEATFDGEINGVIPSGLFARFGEVFEGFVPARRLADDYYELNALGTALVGRRTKRTFRLGDPIEVVVTDIDRAEGKVEVRPA